MTTTKKELSYFRLKLEAYLGEHFPERVNENTFITARADEDMVFSYLNLDYGFHIVSMCILLIFLVYLSAPNNDHSYRFFNLSNSSIYFYKSVIFHLFLFLLYHNKWANHKR